MPHQIHTLIDWLKTRLFGPAFYVCLDSQGASPNNPVIHKTIGIVRAKTDGAARDKANLLIADHWWKQGAYWNAYGGLQPMVGHYHLVPVDEDDGVLAW